MLITLDFETYYSQDFSLSKLTTEEYVRDPRFQVIGVGVKIDDGAPVWTTGTHEEIKNYLSTIAWNDSALVCHNALFDGAILKWVFDIAPAMYFDTLSMARAVNGVDSSGSLASLSKRYSLGEKGEEVLAAKGKRREDFTREELEQYGKYCKNDVDLTYKLFLILSSKFPEEEFELIDMTLRMFTEPTLEVDDALLIDRLAELTAEKFELLGSLMERLKCETEEEVRKKLASNKQFAALLKDFGIEPPMKISPTTGKETYALAKNDEGFLALTEHEDPFIQQLCSVRLGTKSTIEESRIERFIQIGRRNKGKLPIPLKYYGAHTGRWSGSDKVNFQNLPSRDKKKKALKNAVVAPDGYVIINCDSSQIEARILAWLAGQDDLVEEFANGEDVYSIFASEIYNRTISKADPVERFVGKTCILGLGYGTGAAKLQHTLKTQPPGAIVDDEEAKRIVNLYRKKNHRIIDLWEECDRALDDLQDGPLYGERDREKKSYFIGEHKCVKLNHFSGIELPSGFCLKYPALRWDTSEDKSRLVYDSRKGAISIWGGALVENIVQALARCVVAEQMLEIRKRYKVVLTVHDAAVCVVKEEELDNAKSYIVEVMSTPPAWAAGLPIACEAKVGKSYGDC